MRTKQQAFDINRVRELCQLINEGKTPNEALRSMNSSNGYITPLKFSGIYWREKNGTFKALERVRVERYDLFVQKKIEYNKKFNNKKNKKELYNNYKKQSTLFSQPKSKQTTTTNAPKMKAKERQLTFIQRVVKSLFNL